jgi:hypothetical protein
MSVCSLLASTVGFMRCYMHIYLNTILLNTNQYCLGIA